MLCYVVSRQESLLNQLRKGYTKQDPPLLGKCMAQTSGVRDVQGGPQKQSTRARRRGVGVNK